MKRDASDLARRWHLVTCEYPPQLGGVSDYTRLIAEQLALAGDEVHVWRPAGGESPRSQGVTVHDTLGTAGIADLWRLGKQLNRVEGPRRLFVQWVPHGYGFRSMNLPFCLWLWARAAWRRDRVEIMVHEPYLAFREGSRRQDAVAVVHRLMTVILLRAASKVWTSIPAWETCWRPYAIGRKVPFQWLPVVSNVPVNPETSAVARIRQRYLRTERFVVGHFGIHGPQTTGGIGAILPLILDRCPQAVIALLGKGSETFRDQMLARFPQFTGRIQAAGAQAAADLSSSLSACDLLLQPYPDGINTRRGTAMAALAHGIPMVTTIGRLTEEFWKESGAVVTVPAGDPSAFVDAVQRLLDNDSERSRIGQKARRLYEERFDIRHVVEALRNDPVSVARVEHR